MAVISTFMWKCRNQRCAHTFMTSQEGGVIPDFVPCCIRCGDSQPIEGRRTAPGVMSSGTRIADGVLRSQADRYNLKDMGQRGGTKYGETAQRLTHNAPTQTYAPRAGFEIPFSHDPSCAWSKNPPKSTVGVPAGGPKFKSAGKAIPTKVVGTHKG